MIQRTDQRFFVGGNPSSERPGGGCFSRYGMMRVVVLEHIPVQRTVKFGKSRVIGGVGSIGGDKAVAAVGTIDRPAPCDGIACGGEGLQDRRAENRQSAGGGFVHIEASWNILDRKRLAPRHIGVGFMQVDHQAVGAGKLVKQLLDGRDFRYPGTITEGAVQIGGATAVTHAADEAVGIEAGQDQK